MEGWGEVEVPALEVEEGLILVEEELQSHQQAGLISLFEK